MLLLIRDPCRCLDPTEKRVHLQPSLYKLLPLRNLALCYPCTANDGCDTTRNLLIHDPLYSSQNRHSLYSMTILWRKWDRQKPSVSNGNSRRFCWNRHKYLRRFEIIIIFMTIQNRHGLFAQTTLDLTWLILRGKIMTKQKRRSVNSAQSFRSSIWA